MALNVLEGLRQIQDRLTDNDADPATLQVVEAIKQRAALPAAAPATATSALQLVRMLMRTPAADTNVRIYNDLVRLEEEMSTSGAAYRAKIEAEEERPTPKTKKFYKELKEKERSQG